MTARLKRRNITYQRSNFGRMPSKLVTLLYGRRLPLLTLRAKRPRRRGCGRPLMGNKRIYSATCSRWISRKPSYSPTKTTTRPTGTRCRRRSGGSGRTRSARRRSARQRPARAVPRGPVPDFQWYTTCCLETSHNGYDWDICQQREL